MKVGWKKDREVSAFYRKSIDCQEMMSHGV